MISRRNILAGAAGLTFAGIAGLAQTRPIAKLKLGVTARITNASAFLAYERGFFRDEGLDIELVELPGQVEMIPALIAGMVDAGLVGVGPAVGNAVLKGARIRIVAGRDMLVQGCSDQGTIFFRKERFPGGFEKGDWKGMRFALTNESNITQMYLEQLLASRGMKLNDVEVYRQRMQDSVSAAAAGRVDAFFGSGRPEWLEGGLPKNIMKTEMLMKVMGTFQYSHVQFGAKLLDGDPQIGTNFLKAYLKGARRYTAGDSPKFLDDLAARMHLDPKLLKGSCRTGVARNGDVRVQDLERTFQWAMDLKQIPNTMTAAQLAAQTVDLRFLKAAQKAL